MARLKRGDVVAITGASSGIGRATAVAFARFGTRLALLARDTSRLKSLTLECAALGAEARAWEVDVTDAAALERVAGEIRDTFGSLDVWINNAGVGAVGAFNDTPLDVHHRVIETNLLGYLNGAHAALKIFGARGRGTLINNASINAYVAQPNSVGYVTSKFGVRGLTYALRQDFARQPDVDVCLVHPQVVDTKVFEHMANFSGQRVELRLPRVSSARVADVLLNVAKRPRREAYAGRFGHLSVLGHRFFPGLAEFLMICLARFYYAQPHSGKRAGAGNLFKPVHETR